MLGHFERESLEDGERGCITLTASVAAQDGQIGQIIYGSAKAGVNGLVLPMARDLMDFSMQGSFTSVRFLTQVVPFFNARIQGLYKLGRAAKEDPARFSAVIGGAALAGLGLLLAYSDDDDWKKREACKMAAWIKPKGPACPDVLDGSALAMTSPIDLLVCYGDTPFEVIAQTAGRAARHGSRGSRAAPPSEARCGSRRRRAAGRPRRGARRW